MEAFFLHIICQSIDMTNNYFIGIFFLLLKGSNNIKYMFSIMDFPSEKNLIYIFNIYD